MYYKKINGKNVYLSPIDVNDYQIYTKWMNDFETSRFVSQYSNLITENREKEYLEKMSLEGHNYAIVLQEKDQLIGNVSLIDHNPVNQTAELGVFIGEEEMRHKGYGTEAIQLLLSYGFKFLNIHNVMLKVYAINENALEAYKKIGFKEFGKRHECFYYDGKLCDEIYMELLKNEYQE